MTYTHPEEGESRVAVPSQITFELSEYRCRRHTVESSMETYQVDAPVEFGWHTATYLTEMNSESLSSYQCVIVARDQGSPTLILADVERARCESWLVRRRGTQTYR